MKEAAPNHYAILGVDRRCTLAQVRAAYRQLAKQYHPDVNPDSAPAAQRARELNAAHEVLGDAARRRAYDREIAADGHSRERAPKAERNVSHEVRLRLEDFLRGANLVVRVNDPANPDGLETYQLDVPPSTPPGTRFRVPRDGAFAGGFVQVRVRALPSARFKPRGSDLRCELRIDARRAAQGGAEMVSGPTGTALRVEIPPGVARGAIVRVMGEGLPKPRGGRGDLLVRITYRVEVRTSRSRM